MKDVSRQDLDLEPEAMREALWTVGDAILGWFEGLSRLEPSGTARDLEPGPCGPARDAKLGPAGTAHDALTQGIRPGWRSPLADEPLPETGEDLAQLVKLVVEELAPDAQVVGHPGYLAYVAGAGNFISVLGQALSMAINPYTGTYGTAPALVRLEDQVLRWFSKIVGYPDDAAGILTTGSSLAILSAVIAAREKAGAPWDKARCYASDQAHHCVGKSLFAAGFKPENLVVLPSKDFRLDPDSLAGRIRQDKSRGLVPVLAVATAGTTNTGRVDPLDAVASICCEHGIWYHCDAAYGGFFRLLEEAAVLRGMEKADSISLDPHKSLAMPYGTGALLVRRVSDLRFPRGLDSSYMPPSEEGDLRFEYGDISPELSRDFRGLRVWLAIKHFGIAPFRENLREKWVLARRLAGAISEMPLLELVTAPDLSIVTFRMRGDPDDALTRELLARINGGGRFFLTSCRLQGRLVIRACLLGFRAGQATVEGLTEELRAGSAEIAGGKRT